MAIKIPGTEWRPLGPQTEPKMTAHDVICLHTMVGSLSGVDSYFRQGGYSGTESHFGTGGNGAVYQWQDLLYEADANYNSNYRVISIENEDKSSLFPVWSGSNVPLFTKRQVDSLVGLITVLCKKETHQQCPSSWECHKNGIPPVLVPDSKAGRRGIGYHRQGIDPWRVAGGEYWSGTRGKVCPGDNRIEQIPGIIARVQEAMGMASLDEVHNDVKYVGDMVVSMLMGNYGEKAGYKSGDLSWLERKLKEQEARLTPIIEAKVNAAVTNALSNVDLTGVISQTIADQIATKVLSSIRLQQAPPS